MMILMLNIMLAIDLVLMVRHPFDKKESRVPLYVGISILVSAILTNLVVLNGRNQVVARIGSVLSVIVILTYFVVFVFSLIYTWRKLRGPGMSEQVRSLVLKRHILTSVLYIFGNLYGFGCMALALQHGGGNQEGRYDSAFTRTFKILYAFQGFIIPLARLSEPFFFTIMVGKIKCIFN